MDFIKVGWIMNTHGIRGELKIYPLTDNINRFDDLKKVYIGNNKVEAEIEQVKYSKGLAIIKFRDFNNINEVLQYKKDYIYIAKKDRVTLPEGHFFIFDIIECDVYTTKGDKVGTVVDVLQYASNDVYIVKGDREGKEYLIPAVREFVIDVDIENKKIVIDPIEGMIE